ncbi:hypothetical protein KO566_01415 [Flavobacteriaceae bacterium XHP0103]|uniref:hypothetical protein n=1 Tax=Marixanthotalea marina TaxID=2844359 RepID=UPI00298A043D|nr:hypothetical protein [Marixanthotalea marina]MBU3820704.1 hypothetical protein [Marixanthotalea marina]
MRKVLILSFILVLMGSCSLDNDGPVFRDDILPIESVDIPDSFTIGEVYPITVRYFKPTTCYFFNRFYYAKENNIRTVAVINYQYLQNNCEELEDELVEATFDFHVTSNGSYIFKFWQGKDTNGEDQYLTIEVPVTD